MVPKDHIITRLLHARICFVIIVCTCNIIPRWLCRAAQPERSNLDVADGQGDAKIALHVFSQEDQRRRLALGRQHCSRALSVWMRDTVDVGGHRQGPVLGGNMEREP